MRSETISGGILSSTSSAIKGSCGHTLGIILVFLSCVVSLQLSPNHGANATHKPVDSWDVYAPLCIGKYDFAYDCVHTLFRPSAVVIYSKHAQGVSELNDLQFHFFELVVFCLFMLM
jgi:hypothetical protein